MLVFPVPVTQACCIGAIGAEGFALWQIQHINEIGRLRGGIKKQGEGGNQD